jgi:RNA polymerase primary sigma factor
MDEMTHLSEGDRTEKSFVECGQSERVAKEPEEEQLKGELLLADEEEGQLLDEIFGFLEAHGISVRDDEEERTGHKGLKPESPESHGGTRDAILDDLAADDTIGLYLREMVCEPLLTHEEEIELAQRIERGNAALQALATAGLDYQERGDLEKEVRARDEARARFIRANTQLVVSIAKKYRGHGVPFLDLIQEGNLGLMKAVDKYDFRHGTRFSTYATWWIRQSVTRALPSQGSTIRIPLQMTNHIRRLDKASRRLEQELGRSPTPEEIAEAMDLEPRAVRFMIQASRQPLSLQQPVGEEEDSELGDFVADELTGSPADALRDDLLAEQVAEVLDTLTPRQARVLRLRFGLQTDRSYTLKEIGERFGLTRERIRQIQNEALQRLRYSGRADLLRDYL